MKVKITVINILTEKTSEETVELDESQGVDPEAHAKNHVELMNRNERARRDQVASYVPQEYLLHKVEYPKMRTGRGFLGKSKDS